MVDEEAINIEGYSGPLALTSEQMEGLGVVPFNDLLMTNSFQFTSSCGKYKGVLSWKDNKLTFEGDADESAKCFMEHIVTQYNTQFAKYKEAYDALDSACVAWGIDINKNGPRFALNQLILTEIEIAEESK